MIKDFNHSYLFHTVIEEYCITDVFHAQCGNNAAIVMQQARYGRMALGKCLKLDVGFMDCFRWVQFGDSENKVFVHWISKYLVIDPAFIYSHIQISASSGHHDLGCLSTIFWKQLPITVNMDFFIHHFMLNISGVKHSYQETLPYLNNICIDQVSLV